MCARGILTTDMRRDFVRTLMLTDLADNWQTVVAAFADLSKQAEVWFPQQKIQTANRRHDYAVDARYEGQSFEVAVSLSDANISADEFINKFHQAHTDAYGYAIPARAVTLVNCRLVAHGVVAKAEMTRSPIPTGIPAQALSAQAPRPAFSREVYIDGLGWQETPVFSRESLPVGCTLSGPVVVEEMSSTVYLGMGDEVQVDAWRNLIVTVAPARPRGSGDG